MPYLTAKEANQQAYKLQDDVVNKITDTIFSGIDIASKKGELELSTTFDVPQYCKNFRIYDKIAEILTKHGYKITYSLQSFPSYSITISWKEV